LTEALLAGGASQAVWGQHGHARFGRGFNERKFAKTLRAYWGGDADEMRVRFAAEDARFVAGVVELVGDELGLSADDRRRVAAAALRTRLLGESDPSMTRVEGAWRAWWPPPPGADGRERLQELLEAWREWL
jgi:hypothetical protein